MKFKFDSNILLKLALDELKTDLKTFQSKYHNILSLNESQLVKCETLTCNKIHPITKQRTIRKEYIHTTKTANVKTTQHGRIIDVEIKPKNTKPQIVIKKKKVINKY
jgi:hypothetical protein